MAVRTEADPAACIRRHIVSGTLTLSDFRGTLEAAYEDPEMQELCPLWDLRSAHVDMTSAEIHQVADFIGEHWRPPTRVRAALVVSKDFDFAMLRMLELLLGNRSPYEVMVFRDMGAAEAWLKEVRDEA
ncbi:MAG: hypothetical protein P8099_12420 [Gemmatimonadota bacterium]|jgi:hypothetical protein